MAARKRAAILVISWVDSLYFNVILFVQSPPFYLQALVIVYYFVNDGYKLFIIKLFYCYVIIDNF